MKGNLPTLRDLLQARKEDVTKYLSRICNKKSESFWYKKSPAQKAVTLVCHVDTAIGDTDSYWDNKAFKHVTAKVRRRIFFDKHAQVFLGPDGLGGDDRAGVFGLLRVYTSLPDELKPNLLFCDEEETGGKGARDAAKALTELKDSLMLIELDRRGIKDCVFYNDEPKEFTEYVESFGFKKEFGTFSDISHIGKETRLCSTNLSVGYFNEHTKHETLYCGILNDTIKKTIALVSNATKAGKSWTLPEEEKKKTNYYGWYQGPRQRSLRGFKDVYTKEELERHPYLKEWQDMEDDASMYGYSC